MLSVVPDKVLKLQEELKVEGADVASLQVQLEDEQDKRKKWDEEVRNWKCSRASSICQSPSLPSSLTTDGCSF